MDYPLFPWLSTPRAECRSLAPMLGVMLNDRLIMPRCVDGFYIIDAAVLGVFGDGVLDDAGIRINMNTRQAVSIVHPGHALEIAVCEATSITLEGDIEAKLDDQPIDKTALIEVSSEPQRLKIIRGDRVLELKFFIGYDYPVSWRNMVLERAPFTMAT